MIRSDLIWPALAGRDDLLMQAKSGQTGTWATACEFSSHESSTINENANANEMKAHFAGTAPCHGFVYVRAIYYVRGLSIYCFGVIVIKKTRHHALRLDSRHDVCLFHNVNMFDTC